MASPRSSQLFEYVHPCSKPCTVHNPHTFVGFARECFGVLELLVNRVRAGSSSFGADAESRPKQITEIRQFLQIARRKDARSAARKQARTVRPSWLRKQEAEAEAPLIRPRIPFADLTSLR